VEVKIPGGHMSPPKQNASTSKNAANTHKVELVDMVEAFFKYRTPYQNSGIRKVIKKPRQKSRG